MPFIGVLPERRELFRPEPTRAVAVNDAAAWRLYPEHRRVYDKLNLALDAGLQAAPCGVSPLDLGLDADASVFVKPITNLAGMGLDAYACRADQVPMSPGSFWCERLTGTHISVDCLVRDGVACWFAHTRASMRKDAERPLYWEVGVAQPEIEVWLGDWVSRNLAGYTGICNVELIGGRPIEAHLRGSNGFFDFYGPAFMPAWVALVDAPSASAPWRPPPTIPGGVVMSLFGDMTLDPADLAAARAAGVRVQLDRHTPDRVAILRSRDRAAAFNAYRQFSGQDLDALGEG